MICFQISIFEPLETTRPYRWREHFALWFAFKLVSLNHWKQPVAWYADRGLGCDLLSNLYLWTIGNNSYMAYVMDEYVVICFQISIFEPLETTWGWFVCCTGMLWFAFKLVSLNHWKQREAELKYGFHRLWFAFKLVSLNHWKQRFREVLRLDRGCDLLSN